MRLTVVGCAGSHPGPDAACSAYLVEHDGFRLLLDLGNGALGPLQRFVDPRDLDALFLTHLHGDHWLDVIPLLHLRSHHPDGAAPPLAVVVPKAQRARLLAVSGRSGFADVLKLQDPADRRLGPIDLRVCRTRHPVETYAVRVHAGGSTLVYTADTGPFPELAEFARGADVLLAEATFVDGDPRNVPDLHLTATQAGALARDAGVDTLVVTHIAPWHDRFAQLDAAAAAFGGTTLLAHPGLAITVGARR